MLAEWDVVPAVDIDRNDLLVFPSPDDKGIPADLLESVRSSVHRLRFFGWCRPEEWPSDPVVDSIVQSRAKARGWSLVRESGIVMVDPPPETANMRWVEKVLAAYGPMPIRSLYARMSTHAAGPFGERFRLDYPEYKGFLALLRRDHRFAVANGAVTARDHSRANEHLTDTERAVLNVLATRGASVSWADIIEETSHLGLAVATVSLVLQSPLVDRTARGMYALASGGT